MRKVSVYDKEHVIVENSIIVKTSIEMPIDEFFERNYIDTYFDFKDEFDSQDLHAIFLPFGIALSVEIVYLITYDKENNNLKLNFVSDNSKLKYSITPEVIGIFRTYYDKIDNKFRPKYSIVSIRENEYINQKTLFEFFKNKILDKLENLSNFIKSIEYNDHLDKTESMERIKYFEKDITKAFKSFNSYNFWRKVNK